MCWLIVLAVIGMPAVAAGNASLSSVSEPASQTAAHSECGQHHHDRHETCPADASLSEGGGQGHPVQHTAHEHHADCVDVGCVANCATCMYCQGAVTLPVVTEVSLATPSVLAAPSVASLGRTTPFRPPIRS